MIETVISVFGLICAITLFVFRMIEVKFNGGIVIWQ